MARYHINPRTGSPGKCSAMSRACPFGGESEHYDSQEEAYSAFESSMGDAFGGGATAPARPAPVDPVTGNDVAAYKMSPEDTPAQLAHKARILKTIIQSGTPEEAVEALDESLKIHNALTAEKNKDNPNHKVLSNEGVMDRAKAVAPPIKVPYAPYGSPAALQQARNVARGVAPNSLAADTSEYRAAQLMNLQSFAMKQNVPRENLPQDVFFHGEDVRHAHTEGRGKGWEGAGEGERQAIFYTQDDEGRHVAFKFNKDGTVATTSAVQSLPSTGRAPGERRAGRETARSGSGFSGGGAVTGYTLSGGTAGGFFAGGLLGR